jgi:hypothetical protein
VAEIGDVREVMLHGAADLEYWRERLTAQSLQPAAASGQAQVAISAISARYKGIPFRELAVSLLVEDTQSPGDQAFFLIHAFHSLRLFAWIERTCFATPYYPARLEVQTEPIRIAMTQNGQRRFFAERRAQTSPLPASPRDNDWQGRIFVPRRPRDAGRPGQWFWARLAGEATTYAFASGDVCQLEAAAPGVFAQLRASGFAAQRWSVRESAYHARSRTFRASERTGAS